MREYWLCFHEMTGHRNRNTSARAKKLAETTSRLLKQPETARKAEIGL